MNVTVQSVAQPARPSGVSSVITQSKEWHHSNPVTNSLLKFLAACSKKQIGLLQKSEALI